MSFSKYPKYKDSGIEWLGEVPAHWGITIGKRLFSNRKERAYEEDEQLSATQKYGVVPQSQFMESEQQKVTLALSGTSSFRHVDAGDFVISLRSFQGGVEISNYSGCVSPAYTVMTPSREAVGAYFKYLLKSHGFISILNAVSDGIRDGKTISYEQFSSVAFPVPPKEEQRLVASFLDHETARIDALAEEQQHLIKLLKEKRQAVISRAVTKGLDPDMPMKDSGVEWLGEVPAHWEVTSLKRFWSVTDCKHITADFVDDGIPLASIREVQERYVDLSRAKQTTELFYEQLIEAGRKPEEGDLVFSRNATVGAVAQVAAWHPPFAMGQDVCLMKKLSGEYSSDYFQAVLLSPLTMAQLENLMIGSTFKRVNVDDIRGLLVPVPPAHEQKLIAGFINDSLVKIDRLEQEAIVAVELMKEHRSALISAAVTGKIDVRGWQADQQAEQPEVLMAAEVRATYG